MEVENREGTGQLTFTRWWTVWITIKAGISGDYRDYRNLLQWVDLARLIEWN